MNDELSERQAADDEMLCYLNMTFLVACVANTIRRTSAAMAIRPSSTRRMGQLRYGTLRCRREQLSLTLP